VNSTGNPSLGGYQLSNGGGSGGGGGGGDDDGTTSFAGDGIITASNDEGGAGGGGGGGGLNITSAGDIVISGSLSSRGGTGGNTTLWGWIPQDSWSFGVGGGGGSGGTIIVQGTTVNVSSANIDVRGGTNGVGYYNGVQHAHPTGGLGGDGWIRLESSSGNILGAGSANINPNTAPSYSTGLLNVNTTQGQSLFYDSNVEDPDFLDNSSGGFLLNCILNSGSVRVFVQGAEVDLVGDPDTQTYWPNNPTNTNPTWEMVYDSTAVAPSPVYVTGVTSGINIIDRYRFFRFRVEFGNLLNVFPPGPFLTDITFPYRD
jgi:hypothetical protein